MKKIVLILGLITFGVQAQQKGLRYSVSTSLMEHLKEYIDELDYYGIDYSLGNSLILKIYDIGRTKGGGSIAGIAIGMYDDSKVEVYIDVNHWKYSSPRQRKWTVYHELSHDIFNITHCEVTIMDTVVPDQISYSLMKNSIEELMTYLKENN
tara:strand:- start:335 stop:790 length:456 start_codon:yes stop_codon:yes gene_type:complete